MSYGALTPRRAIVCQLEAREMREFSYRGSMLATPLDEVLRPHLCLWVTLAKMPPWNMGDPRRPKLCHDLWLGSEWERVCPRLDPQKEKFKTHNIGAHQTTISSFFFPRCKMVLQQSVADWKETEVLNIYGDTFCARGSLPVLSLGEFGIRWRNGSASHP